MTHTEREEASRRHGARASRSSRLGTRRLRRGLPALVCAAGFILLAGAAQARVTSGPARAAAIAHKLGPGVEVALHEATGKVRFIGTSPGRPISPPAGVSPASAPASAATAFFDRHARELGVAGRRQSLDVTASNPGPAQGSSVRLQQRYAGVPVIGGEFVVNMDSDNGLLSVSGEASPSPGVGVAPVVAKSEARATAVQAIAKARRTRPAKLAATRPQLWVYDPDLLGGPAVGGSRLVWRTEVTGRSRPKINELVLVDAQLGSVALHFNQAAEALNRSVCNANNTSSQLPCTSPVRTEGQAATGNTDVDQAYDFSGDTYNFYASRFGRDSLNGAGLPLKSTVKYCDPSAACPYQNAFWSPGKQQMVYGDGFASADDVVGHELTHGVTDFTSHLFYYYQSGAINESLSDVFGELIDLTNGRGTDTAATRWQLGEDLPASIGVIRDMENPPAFGDPDKMTSANYVNDPSDAGGVHTNSGVNNKAAFLMTDGGTFNGQTITGLGIDKVARIYYAVETSMLTSASDYADLGNALEQGCANLVGTGGITAANCTQVQKAVVATEMATDPPNAPAPDAPVCDSGAPSNVYFDNLENPGSGNWAHSATVGVDHWYYPATPNPFNFDGTYATSGNKNFWGFDQGAFSDISMAMTSSVSIPAGAFLRFNHAYEFEGLSSHFDGGVVEYSTDSGANWHDAGPLFINNGYNGTLVSSNQLGPRQAFTAVSHGYYSSRADLSSLAGSSVRFRFRIGTDSSVSRQGWFIDDIRIYTCGSSPPAAPTVTGTAPSSPANDNNPEVQGTVGAGSPTQVKIFKTSDCTGPVAATGTVAAFTGAGVSVNVPDNSVTQLSAKASNGSGDSPCSATAISYREDSAPPGASIASGPAAGSTTNDPTPTFGLASSEPGSTFQCKVDAGAFAACTTPRTLAHLNDGAHTFQVRAIDQAGNTGAPTSRSFTVKTAEVLVSGSKLVVTSAAGAKDNLVVTKPSASTIRVTDLPSSPYAGSGIHTGAGCTRSGDSTANCNAAGITLIQVASGDQTDKIANSTAVPGALNGGSGNDNVGGGSGKDTLTGGTGADTMKGMNGNDTLLARDLASDTLINCDGGSAAGTADKADLDVLPKDPNAAVIGCETKTRH